MLSNMAVKNRVYGLIELDVTEAREYIHSYREKTGETSSFTGWMIKCMGQVVSEDKQMQAYKKGRNRLVIFDVGVSIVVERQVISRFLAPPSLVKQDTLKLCVGTINAEMDRSLRKDSCHNSIVRKLFK